MQTTVILLIALACIALVLGISVWRSRQRARSAALREKFGPEYDNAVEQLGSPSRAERELRRRAAHVRKLPIRALTRQEYDRFSSAWSATQKQFVDDPIGAIRAADALIKEVMSARGYGMGDFEQRVAEVSVDHGQVVQHYRAARALVRANDNGQASTEDLRQAMIHYRTLYQDLLQVEEQGATELREVRV